MSNAELILVNGCQIGFLYLVMAA